MISAAKKGHYPFRGRSSQSSHALSRNDVSSFYTAKKNHCRKGLPARNVLVPFKCYSHHNTRNDGADHFHQPRPLMGSRIESRNSDIIDQRAEILLRFPAASSQNKNQRRRTHIRRRGHTNSLAAKLQLSLLRWGGPTSKTDSNGYGASKRVLRESVSKAKQMLRERERMGSCCWWIFKTKAAVRGC